MPCGPTNWPHTPAGPSPKGRRSRFASVDLGIAYSNPKAQVTALRRLMSKLPMGESSETPGRASKPSQQRRRITKLTPAGEADLVTAYTAGATVYQLAAQFGIDRKTVSRILRRHHVPMRRTGLTPTDIANARQLRTEGWTLRRIGDHLGVDPRTISRSLKKPDN